MALMWQERTKYKKSLPQNWKTESGNNSPAPSELCSRLDLHRRHCLSAGSRHFHCSLFHSLICLLPNTGPFKRLKKSRHLKSPCHHIQSTQQSLFDIAPQMRDKYLDRLHHCQSPQMQENIELATWQPVFICLAMFFSITAGLSSIACRFFHSVCCLFVDAAFNTYNL